MTLVLALTRNDIASYVNALFEVYILLIFIYILTNWMFSFGVRTPYNRFSDAILNFLRDVCEPYLRLYPPPDPSDRDDRHHADHRDRGPLHRGPARGELDPGVNPRPGW